jgi:hypothetical protein
MESKPKLVVFDDEGRERVGVLQGIVGLDYDVVRIDYFTKESTRKGEVGVGIIPAKIVESKPVALVVDLVLFPDERDWTWGMNLVATLYRSEKALPPNSTPSLTRHVMIVSNLREEETRGYDRFRKRLVEDFGLTITRFYWKALADNDPAAIQKFRNAVEHAQATHA